MSDATGFAHLVDVLGALRGASDIDAAATLCLRAALAIVTPLAGRRALRASLHLRPAAGYRGLFVLEAGAEAVTAPHPDHRLMPSASAWRHAQQAGRPVLVDALRRTLRAVDASDRETAPRYRARALDPMSEASQRRLLRRDATHVCVLPVLHAGAAIGFVAVELADLKAVGTDAIWPDCVDALELLVALAAPLLAALPAGQVPASVTDPLLPVVGPTMAPVVRVAGAFAREEETLLVIGETGTGKSRLARWCHSRSARADGPFEVLDLLGIPPEMQMAELFGWKRGAFTGAVADHHGFVTRARGGTLFIDEVDKLSLDAQAGLLTLLEERTYRVLGSRGGPEQADVRFIVGTNADLAAEVARGAFRQDLYYRLDVLSVALPPLRERLDEIGDWAHHMLTTRHAEARGDGAVELSADAHAALGAHPWHGNLRELNNAVRRAYVLAGLDAEARGDGVVRLEARHLRPRATPPSPAPEQPTPAPAAAPDAPSPAPDGTLARLSVAHARLVERLAARRGIDGLDLSGAIYGLLLAEAVRFTADRAAAFELIGRGELVRNRNHHRVLKREAARTATLADWLDEPVPPATRALLEGR